MAKRIKTGLDILADESCERLRGLRIGLLANPASVTTRFVHAADLLIGAGVEIARIFGPQHGFRGDTQANMIEWEDHLDDRTSVPVHSLYGRHREPEAGALDGLDAVVVDLPDVGARPYTYLWTAMLVMRACAARGVPLVVCDRPNPIGGERIEGPILERDYESFVGLYPLAMRHGMTIAEALLMINTHDSIGCRIDIVKMSGWRRNMMHEDTGLPWIMPSPNMPSASTALVYPGTVMLEGTNISEGRGTTRPFELVGAPWMNGYDLADALAGHGLEGVAFRPCSFRPMWDKHADLLCNGVQIHVIDPALFHPVRCGAFIIAAAAMIHPDDFAWSDPPYEYEYDKPPIDIIAGGARLRETIDARRSLRRLFNRWTAEEKLFEEEREPFLLY